MPEVTPIVLFSRGESGDVDGDGDGGNAELDATRELLAENARIGERVRIARDLHDLLGHHLTALSVNLEVARHLAQGEPRSRIETAQSLTRLLLGDVRDAVGSLRGREGIALGGALRKLAEGIPQPRVHLEMDDGLSVEDPEAARVLLRCAQEIVTNAVRHARAQNLWLDVLSEEGRIRIRTRDDGQGAETPGEGHGLAGMRERLEERGGSLEVWTSPGRGFTVTAVCPAAAAS